MESINISGLIRGANNEEDKSHVKALRYSLYNAATLIIAAVICGALVSVYFVLEAFIQPLVWAVLIGCVLFPIKVRLTSAGLSWLRGIKTNGTPLTFGLVLLPLKMVDSLAEQLWTHIFAYWKPLLSFLVIGAICFVLSTVELLYPVTFIWNCGYLLYSILGVFRAEWVWTCAFMYIIVIAFFKDSFQSICPRVHLSNIAVFIWISLIFHLSTWLGILRIPVGVGLVVAFFVGSWNNFKLWILPDDDNDDSNESSEEGLKDSNPLADVEEEEGDDGKEEVGLGDRNPETIGSQSGASSSRKDNGNLNSKSHIELSEKRRRKTTPSLPRSRSFSIADALDSIKEMTPFADFIARRHQRHDFLDEDALAANALNRLFLWLFFACLVVYVFKHPAILQLLPLPTLFIIIKRSLFYLWKRYEPLSYIDESTKELIIPKPIWGLWSVVRKGDQKILVLIEATISKVTTIILLCLLLIFTTLFCIIMFAQVQRESVELVMTSANLINETVSRNPEIAKWFPQSDTMHSTFGSVIEKGYEHGREWMAKKISGLITGNGGDDSNKLKVEKELLDVIDDLYRSWHTNQSDTSDGVAQLCKLGFTSCPSALTNIVKKGRKDQSSQPPEIQDAATQTDSKASMSQMWLFVDNMMKSEWVTTQFRDILDVNRILEIMRDNIGSVVSILESLWLIIRSNVNSVFNFVTAMISLLFGGGTVLLNFFVSSVVFLTALFYLLSISEKDYKPVGWITTFFGPIVPTGEIEAAISSVLLATLKMAVFYGFYTWLTHSIFGVNIVFIPSALAAIFAAVPFIGTYCAAIPAMIELWILKDDLLRAILLLFAHLIPTYFIDMLIYGGIKDGGHPYLTGLAIVGGIYFLGLQGAIIGPILLCCLIVVFNVYRTILVAESISTPRGEDPVENPPSGPNPRFDRNLPNPGIYLHRSTPTNSSPCGVGDPIVISPATPNSTFHSNDKNILRKAMFGSRRPHRSNSLPSNVEGIEA